MNLILAIVIVTFALLAGAEYLFHRSFIRRKKSEAEQRARALVEDAERQADLRLKELEIESREKADAADAAFEQEMRKKRTDLQASRRQIEDQERLLERKAALLTQKQSEVEAREGTLREREATLVARQQEFQALMDEQRVRLERLAGMSAQQAKRELMREMEGQARAESAVALKRIEDETRERAETEARRILTSAAQRVPVGQIVDLACSLVMLPNDEMKGRIIGREGRNIRAIEMATGIDLIVDDTPGAILLSGFDPMRREIARVSIEKLVEDGRIHPGRIEEVVQKVREEVDQITRQAGEAAAFEMGIVSLPDALARLVGRTKFFLISGYNLLQLCRETATMASAMAAELDLGSDLVKRAGLLHGIGWVGDSTSDSPPLLLASEMAGRLGESPSVVQAIRSMHPSEPETSVEAVLLRIARKVSLSRPGMRRENMEIWMTRMRDMEQAALSFPGVSRAFAMRSGKELRVLVETDKISDADVLWLSKDIAAKIERDLHYPGQVRVSVIRETRAVDFAK
ncbi:MAG TPA: ribonuclease Y [Candidatus Polarisedimenticolia bacterium]|nr:ribonuclease Y [Candidatus Polarisedimenticolia bacterium]